MLNFYIYVFVGFVIFLVLYGVYNYFFRKVYHEPIYPNFWNIASYNQEKKKYYKTEEKCREIFKELTGENFRKVRPNFLKYHTGHKLELDGYCPQLGIAFEYNGIQHYRYVPFFHQNIEDFHEQQRHDQFKKEICEKLGIKLITIPYTLKNDSDMRAYIIREVLKK